jgi:AraC-like DNA-binding protein
MHESPTEYSLPATHFVHVLKAARRWNVTPEDILAGLPFTDKDLADPRMTVPVPTAITILERARKLTGEPGLGIYLGLQTYSSEHGYLGFAAMSASTIREVLELIVKYAPIRTTAFAFSTRTDGPRTALVVDERADFGSARDIVLLSLFMGMRHMAVVHLGRKGSNGIGADSTFIHLTLPEPPYYARFRHIRPEVRFGRRANELVFETELLDLPLATADPVSARLAREQCEQILESVAARPRLVEQVAGLVVRSDGGQRSCEEVAALMRTSPRTLRRRLADEGTTFLDVRDHELRDRAIVLLRSKELSLGQIASKLGYANSANFLRAFRKWTGHPATHYRPDASDEATAGRK